MMLICLNSNLVPSVNQFLNIIVVLCDFYITSTNICLLKFCVCIRKSSAIFKKNTILRQNHKKLLQLVVQGMALKAVVILFQKLVPLSLKRSPLKKFWAEGY